MKHYSPQKLRRPEPKPVVGELATAILATIADAIRRGRKSASRTQCGKSACRMFAIFITSPSALIAVSTQPLRIRLVDDRLVASFAGSWQHERPNLADIPLSDVNCLDQFAKRLELVGIPWEQDQ